MHSHMHACLAATRGLHIWQNDRELLRATAVTRGVKWTPKQKRWTLSSAGVMLHFLRPQGHNLAAGKGQVTQFSSALGKTHMRFTPSLRRFPDVSFETVPRFV